MAHLTFGELVCNKVELPLNFQPINKFRKMWSPSLVTTLIMVFNVTYTIGERSKLDAQMPRSLEV